MLQLLSKTKMSESFGGSDKISGESECSCCDKIDKEKQKYQDNDAKEAR